MDAERTKVEDLARKLAANGAGYLFRYRNALERAEAILAQRELEKLEMLGSPLYAWEHGPMPCTDQALRIFTATAAEIATGQGLTASFMAIRALSETEVRRRMASWIGPHLADAADVRKGWESLPAAGAMFVSDALQRSLEEADLGRLPGFSHFAQHHENRA